MTSPADEIGTWRTIVKTHRFDQDQELAEMHYLNVKRGDEFIENMEWLPPWKPSAGQQLVPSQVWFIPIAAAAGTVALYYMFNEHRVVFLSIKSLHA